MFSSEIIVVPAVFGIPATVMVIRMWFKHKEALAKLAGPRADATVDARLTSIEQSLEAIAIEVERMGEGQRFVTKLLAERHPGAPALPAHGGEDSPGS